MVSFAFNYVRKIRRIVLLSEKSIVTIASHIMFDFSHFSGGSKGVGCATIVNMETSKTSMFRFTAKSTKKCLES